MLSVQPPNTTKKFPAELSPSALHPATAAAAGKPLLSPRPNGNGFIVPVSPRFAGAAGEGLDKWFQDLQKYEATLGAMAAASEDPKFKEELGTIEQWFKLLSESEQTASLYTLLQNVNQGQIKFLMAILSQMSDNNAAENLTNKQSGRSLRPPSLNIPLPGSPATPQFSANPADDKNNVVASELATGGQDLVVKPSDENSWASMVNTPHDLMFKKGSEATQQQNGIPGLPGMINPASAGLASGMLTPLNMAMLNNMGFSNEAQLLAVQLVMSGMMQPNGTVAPKSATHQQRQHPNKSHGHQSNNWRSPASARYPGSALRSSGLRSSGLKTSGLKSASSVGSMATPKEDDIDPELLKDVPAWLKSLRLHKYTDCFKGMTWEQMVELDEPTLEAKGVAALGARRRLTRTFDSVKRKMGMETAPSVPATAAVESKPSLPSVSPVELIVPHSAAPRF